MIIYEHSSVRHDVVQMRGDLGDAVLNRELGIWPWQILVVGAHDERVSVAC